MGCTMKGLPRNLQPDEKCRIGGPESLDDSELMAVVLRTGTRGLTALELARTLLREAGGSLSGLKAMSGRDLMKIHGMGEIKTLQLQCMLTLAGRIAKSAIVSGADLSSPEKVACCYMEEMRSLSQEEVRVLYLNTRNCLIREETVSRGTVNESMFPCREILFNGLRCGAVHMILMHNHPSGDPSPSVADVEATRQAAAGGRITGIELTDHIIIGDRCYFSMREQGVLT